VTAGETSRADPAMTAFLGPGPWGISFQVLSASGEVLLSHECRNVSRWRTVNRRAKRRLLSWAAGLCEFYEAEAGTTEVLQCTEYQADGSAGTVLLRVPGGAVNVRVCTRHRAALEIVDGDPAPHAP